jgi:hypothetical protein
MKRRFSGLCIATGSGLLGAVPSPHCQLSRSTLKRCDVFAAVSGPQRLFFRYAHRDGSCGQSSRMPRKVVFAPIPIVVNMLRLCTDPAEPPAICQRHFSHLALSPDWPNVHSARIAVLVVEKLQQRASFPVGSVRGGYARGRASLIQAFGKLPHVYRGMYKGAAFFFFLQRCPFFTQMPLFYKGAAFYKGTLFVQRYRIGAKRYTFTYFELLPSLRRMRLLDEFSFSCDNARGIRIFICFSCVVACGILRLAAL